MMIEAYVVLLISKCRLSSIRGFPDFPSKHHLLREGCFIFHDFAFRSVFPARTYMAPPTATVSCWPVAPIAASGDKPKTSSSPMFTRSLESCLSVRTSVLWRHFRFMKTWQVNFQSGMDSVSLFLDWRCWLTLQMVLIPLPRPVCQGPFCTAHLWVRPTCWMCRNEPWTSGSIYPTRKNPLDFQRPPVTALLLVWLPSQLNG